MKLFKKLQQFTLGLIAMSFMFTSCDSEDPTPAEVQATSYFTYQGNTYALDAGCITPDANDNFIVLYSSGVQLNADLDGFTGVGDAFSFSIYGPNVVGNFTFDNTTQTPAASGECDDMRFILNADASIDGADGTELNDGNITITNDANGAFVIDASGSNYILHYEGSLTTANVH